MNYRTGVRRMPHGNVAMLPMSSHRHVVYTSPTVVEEQEVPANHMSARYVTSVVVLLGGRAGHVQPRLPVGVVHQPGTIEGARPFGPVNIRVPGLVDHYVSRVCELVMSHRVLPMAIRCVRSISHSS